MHFFQRLNSSGVNNIQTKTDEDVSTPVKDLISLDDSIGSNSFDLNDFDPLNQNARPLPLSLSRRQKFPSEYHPNHFTNIPTNTTISFHTIPPTMPMVTTSSLPLTSPSLNMNMPPVNNNTGVAIVAIPGFGQQLNSGFQQNLPLPLEPPPLPATNPPSMPSPDEDYELLRKYGLDQFTLNGDGTTTTTTALILQNAVPVESSISSSTVSSSISNTLETTVSSSIASGMQNWTTFD